MSHSAERLKVPDSSRKLALAPSTRCAAEEYLFQRLGLSSCCSGELIFSTWVV